jgi:hypothetical protein
LQAYSVIAAPSLCHARKKKSRAVVEPYRIAVMANGLAHGVEQWITLARRKR